MGKGDHEITSSWTDPIYDSECATTLGITRSNITFVGTGEVTTTVLGGFAIYNHENITFKQMTSKVSIQAKESEHRVMEAL